MGGGGGGGGWASLKASPVFKGYVMMYSCKALLVVRGIKHLLVNDFRVSKLWAPFWSHTGQHNTAGMTGGGLLEPRRCVVEKEGNSLQTSGLMKLDRERDRDY